MILEDGLNLRVVAYFIAGLASLVAYAAAHNLFGIQGHGLAQEAVCCSSIS